MERRTFIKLSTLTSFGLIVGGNVFASVFKNEELIEIEAPNIHVRHGIFNLQATNHNGLHIQRDVFNRNGLEEISEDRMVSIKISDNNKDSFCTIDKTGLHGKSRKLSAVKLKANNSRSIKIDSPSLIFSEHDDFLIDGMLILKQQAIMKKQRCVVKLRSTKDQHLVIYNI